MGKSVRIWPITGLDIHYQVDKMNNELRGLTPTMESRVSKLWDCANEKRGGALFNGRLLSISAASEAPSAGTVVGEFTEYRRFLAQLEDPSLYGELQVNPLAVTGLIDCADGILIGKRGEVTEDAEYWEVLPSGGVGELCVSDSGEVDLASQLRREFEEEVGKGLPGFVNVSPAFWMLEESTHVVDIVLRATVKSTLTEVLQRFKANKNREYEAVDAISLYSVADKLKNERHIFSNTTICILEALLADLSDDGR